MAGVRWFGVGIGAWATSCGALGRGQGFLGGGFETRVLVEAGLAIEGRGVIGLTELAIWGRGVDLVSDTAG